MEKEQLQDINKMSKSDLRFELDNLRIEYEHMMLQKEIYKLVDRIASINALQEIKEFVEKIYEKKVTNNCIYTQGARDNIVDMADNLLKTLNWQQLKYFNEFMYGMLLNSEPSATEGLYNITPNMENMLLKHLQKKGA